MVQEREQMNVVVVGHVDHGKSTLIGRLLADTGALPQGKLEAVKANCARNAKPFEYAFLLDALKDEQSQGITIDTARCFFKSKLRDYIIIDAPGHIEFLKNMITGAARAEAAMLVIDAKEGIRENSKRHGYMLSFLGIKNINVCVNKMDLVNYDEATFDLIKKEYSKFLEEVNLQPQNFIPISAREGDNVVELSTKMPWYKGYTILQAFDQFTKTAPTHEKDVRFPVQDIYKFTQQGDERRIVAGRVESGTIQVGDEVVFLPSNKKSKISSIEGFNVQPVPQAAFAGQSTGFTLDTQIYIKPGEIMCKTKQKLPHVSTKFKANIFWMGRQPLVKNKNYKLKLVTQKVPVVLSEIVSVLDASELSSMTKKDQVDRHDVAECIFETLKPIAFDAIANISQTGRFVVVDNYEIAGGGIILAPVFEESSTLKAHIKAREYNWVRGRITPDKRNQKHQHKPLFVILSGPKGSGKLKVARELEENLFKDGKNAYFLSLSHDMILEDESVVDETIDRIRHIRQLGELAHVMTDSGHILITSITDMDEFELDILKSLNLPNKTVVINVGESHLSSQYADLNVPSQEDKDVPATTALIMKKLAGLTTLDPEFAI